MSASLARTVFRPSTAARVPTSTPVKAASGCPISLFASPATSSRPGGSARTANALAHLTVGAALFASAYSFASRPDTLLFDHPPRSAIGWQPSKHIAVREANTASRSSTS
ncbi:hypothetical protein JCM11251_002401 [Rhodosporidiobolus azoricus]